MGYMDLNIPYPEPSGSNKKSMIDSNRTKIAVKAMELGYTGIAYNRTITGVMSDQHRCSISPLNITSLFKLLPILSSSAKLHRDLLGIPMSTPFRQYTRLTVCVDSGPQCQAMNSGNPILKTYDLVAVKPMNQNSFDMACEKMEVDIISIDLSIKLPFRLKQNLIKAAVQRGVHFEVTYACLITDIQSRKNLITSAKMLMDWTRGRNILFSSAAPSVNEFRGPLDAANLLSLLGISKDRAREAISKNCRILLANSLKKKRFYKEAIRVEVLSSDVASHSKEGWYQELLKWDPISSGEGDILLDDLTKSLPTSCETPKTVKAINFDNMPSQSFEVKDFLPESNVFDNSTELPKEDIKIVEHGVLEIRTSISEDLMDGEQFNECKTDSVELNEIPLQQPDEKKMEDCSAFSLPDGMLGDTEVGKVSTDYVLEPLAMSQSAKKKAKRKKAHLERMYETFPKDDLKVAEHGVSEINTSISENLMDAVELSEIPQQKPDEKKMEDYSVLLLPDGMLRDTELGKVSTGCELVPSVKSRSAKKKANGKKDHGLPDTHFDTQLLNPVPVTFKKEIKKRKNKPEIN